MNGVVQTLPGGEPASEAEKAAEKRAAQSDLHHCVRAMQEQLSVIERLAVAEKHKQARVNATTLAALSRQLQATVKAAQ